MEFKIYAFISPEKICGLEQVWLTSLTQKQFPVVQEAMAILYQELCHAD